MTIPEEIELLKIKLDHTAGESEQAEVLLDILSKYAIENSIETQPYIDRLFQLAEKPGKPVYKAWSIYYSALLEKNKEDYARSLELFHQALERFKTAAERKGIENSLDGITKIHLHRNNFQEAHQILLVSLQDMEGQPENKRRLADIYNNLGNVQQTLGKYDEALITQRAALKLRDELGDKTGAARSYSNIGNSLRFQGRYPESLQNHFESLKIIKETDDKLFLARIYNNIGNVYKFQGNYTDALKYYFDSLHLKEQIGDKQGIGFSYNNIGVVYQEQHRHTEALDHYLVALKIRQELNDKWGISACLGNIGNVYESLGDYNKALEYHLQALTIGKEIGDQSGVVRCYHNIGSAFRLLKKYPEALENFYEAKKLGEGIGLKEVTRSASLSLSLAYTGLGDHESALKYYQKYHQAEKEMLGEESTRQLNNLSFMHNLEQKEKDLEIEQLRNVELKKERDRSESLLLNILPAEVAEELKEKGSADAKLFDDVTVLFTDFKSFTKVSEHLTPQELVDELNTCFSAFDNIISKYNIEKIKTVGDAYLAAAGLPSANRGHAEDIVNAAIEIRTFMLNRHKEHGSKTFEIRIGMHSGPVVAGIVGVKKFAYDIWGDTVNTAARMEQNSEAGKINISHTTYQLIKDKFDCVYRGEIEAKNKGLLKMYFVL